MKKIHIRMLRELWKIKHRSLAIILSIAFGVSVYAGVDMAIRNLFSTRDVLYQDMNFADLEIQFLPEDVNNLPDISDIEGIDKVERRLVFPGTIILGEHQRILGIIVFLETIQPEINTLKLVQGQPMRGNDFQSAVIEQSLSKYHAFKVGETLQIKVGERIYENKVSGIALSPEYLTISANPDYFIPEKGTLGVVFGDLRRVDDALGFTMVNDLIFTFKEGADKGRLKETIVERLSKLNIEKITTGDEHFSYRFIEMDLGALSTYVFAFVIILVVMSFIITFLTFNRMAHIQEKEVGTFFAIGYGKRDCIFSYMIGGIILGALGCVVGLGLSILIRNAFSLTYAHALGLPVCYHQIVLASVFKGIVLGVTVAVTSAVIPTLKWINLLPQDMIRGRRKDAVRISALTQKLFALMAVLPIEYRFGVRNLIRRKGLSLSTIFCIALSVSIAISYMISITSINRTVADTFNSENWSLAVDFLYPVFDETAGELRDIEGVKQLEPYLRSNMEIGKVSQGAAAAARYENSIILGILPNTHMKRIHLIEGTGFQNPNDNHRQIIVSQDLRDKLKATVGDMLVVKKNNKQFDCRLVGVTAEIVIGQSIVPFKTAQEITGYLDEISGAYINADSKTVVNRLYEKEFVGKVTLKKQLVGSFLRVMSELMMIVYLAAAISIFMALIFIFTSILLSVTERVGEYATLRSIGYGKKSLVKIIYSEAMTQGIVACCISIITAIWLSGFLNYRLGKAWFQVQNYYLVSDFIIVIALTLVLIPLAAHIGVKHILKLEIPEAIRTKSME